MIDEINTKISEYISYFVNIHESTKNHKNYWREPIVAFADASDPLFSRLKKVVSPEHFLPSEILRNCESVIVYFIPFKGDVVQSNSKGLRSSKEWAEAYILTNQLIVRLNRFLSEKIQNMGFETVEIPPTHNFDEEKLISYWSHKHVAYIAGLGKFGLHKMIITEKGCCGRLGSIVTDLKLQPTDRPKNEFCLYFYNQSCAECVEKCPFGALGIDDFDRKKCYQVCLSNAELHSKIGYADVCGKCSSNVPCSLKNPVRRDREKLDGRKVRK